METKVTRIRTEAVYPELAIASQPSSLAFSKDSKSGGRVEKIIVKKTGLQLCSNQRLLT